MIRLLAGLLNKLWASLHDIFGLGIRNSQLDYGVFRIQIPNFYYFQSLRKTEASCASRCAIVAA